MRSFDVMRSLVALAVVGIIFVPLSVFPKERAERAAKHIEATIWAFEKVHHRFPRNIPELQKFAAARSEPLDIEPFAKLTLKSDRYGADLNCVAKPPSKFWYSRGYSTGTITVY
jgi:hypothetical protein